MICHFSQGFSSCRVCADSSRVYKCLILDLGELTGVMDQMDSQEEVEVVAVMKAIVAGDTDPIRRASQLESSLFFRFGKARGMLWLDEQSPQTK